jgi:hypothetical protein
MERPEQPELVVDELSGPTLEIRYMEILYGRGADLWEILLLAKPDCETRIRIDWNGINARAWDMSFVPWDRECQTR